MTEYDEVQEIIAEEKQQSQDYEENMYKSASGDDTLWWGLY